MDDAIIDRFSDVKRLIEKASENSLKNGAQNLDLRESQSN